MPWIPIVSNILLGLLVFGLSASVDVASFRDKLKKKNGILIGLACQFFLLPLIGFLTVVCFQLKEVYGITLLVVMSSPGGSYSNLWCSFFNADLALSVAMTAASTIVSAAMLPLNLLLYINLAYRTSGAANSLDWPSLFTSIGVVITAVCLGLLVSSYSSEEFQKRSALFGNIAGIGLITFSVIVSSRDEPIWDKPFPFYIAIATPCVLALILALSLTSIPKCGLAKPERVAVAIETCYQNVGVATAVALSMFKGHEQSKAVGVPLYYGFIEAVILAIFCVYAWKAGWTFAPSSAYDVLGKTKNENQPYGIVWFLNRLQMELNAIRVVIGSDYQPRTRGGSTASETPETASSPPSPSYSPPSITTNNNDDIAIEDKAAEDC
jgi:predicted Na+-dependent transporter